VVEGSTYLQVNNWLKLMVAIAEDYRAQATQELELIDAQNAQTGEQAIRRLTIRECQNCRLFAKAREYSRMARKPSRLI
jgi:hypothetical protein